MTLQPTRSGALNLGHILALGGVVDFSEVLVIRHTYTKDGITAPGDATASNLLAYTRGQSINPRTFPTRPPPTWITFSQTADDVPAS